MQYWLMKSEPSVFSIDDLKNRPRKTEPWEGVRNYQARNMMRDQMQQGDLALFYHSSCEEPGIVGIMEIIREGYPDPSAFDPGNIYHDPKSDPENPVWYQVDVKFRRKFRRTITLAELRKHRKLADMKLVQKGNRLSVMPVTVKEWDFILGLE